VINDSARIKPMGVSLQKQREELRSLSDKIRSVQEVPVILSTISSIASEYGVKIDELDPEKDLQKSLATASYGNYYSLPIVLKARCGYHKFGHFLNKLEKEDLFFIMQDFIIQNDPSDPKSRSFSMTIQMILVDRITYDEDLSVTDLSLEGIMTDGSGNNVAIVNGKIIKPNDQVGPYVVTAIDIDHVEFLKGSEKFILRMKKGS
jgi:hypothetical protein